MTSSVPFTAVATDAPDISARRRRRLLLGVVLVLAVYVAGSPDLNAPWVLGDEYIFIVDNPDVNPAAAPPGHARSLGARLAGLFTEVHEDLYQPLPLATYALEWTLTGGRPGASRCVDLLLHALNALLLWWVLSTVLRRVPGVESVPTGVLAWGLALLWALHPMLITTYALDMGRTHLLSAMFALLALGCYLQWSGGGRRWNLVGMMAALLLAMLCKPIPGWILLLVVLEAARDGAWRTLRAPHVWLVAILCVGFGLATYWTTRASGIMADASKGLFGDPVTRSALAVWIYARNIVAPLWLAYWYLPDPRTGWGDPFVWAGLALAAASVIHALWACRRAETRWITIGWVWCWALLLPVIGLVGARESAAVDRYMYQPLMGIALVVGVLAARGLAHWPPRRGLRILAPTIAVVAVAMLLWDLPQVRIARSVIRRAQRVVNLNPGDPRALEALAVAYDFARNHPLLPDETPTGPEGQADYYRERAVATLRQAAATPNLTYYFPGPADEGPFHRRLAYRFLLLGDPEQSLAQAEAARKLLPDEFLTWKRLAHAFQALGRWNEAVAAYERCAQLLPSDPRTRAIYYTDFGDLLMFDLGRDAEACAQFSAAMDTGCAPPAAKIGLAACEIRYGKGEVGFRLISDVLEADPGNVQAGLVLAEYHLRSHHWEAAAAVYEAILHDAPTNYTALRGYHEVCLHTQHYRAAALAWHDAVTRAPHRREFASYLVWAMALAGEGSAAGQADNLLRLDPDNRFACFAHMLLAIRADRPKEAVDWIARVRAGQPVPEARTFLRVAATLRLLTGRGELPPETVAIENAVYLLGDSPQETRSTAREALQAFTQSNAPEAWKAAARLALALAEHPESLPTTSPSVLTEN